jgi:hypothetical protein
MPKKEKATPKAKASKKPKAEKPTALPSDVDAMKKAIKERTGKTEAECEDIIAQYRKLRAKAKVNSAKRTERLKSDDKLIAGTNVITPVAQIEKDAEIVKAKIEKQVEQIENKAEREVVKKDKTKDEVKVEVEQKVVKQLAKLSDDMVLSATTFVKNIQTELKKVDKTEAKNFLLGLRNEIDALLSKFGDGGGISKFDNGGEVKKKIVKKFDGYYEDYRGEHVVSLVKEEDGSGYYFLDTTNGYAEVFKEKSRTKNALERYVRKNYMVVSKFGDGGSLFEDNFESEYNSMSKNDKEELMRETIGVGRTPFSEYENYNQLSDYHKELVDNYFTRDYKKMADGGGVKSKTNSQRIKALVENLDNTPYSIGLAILRERLLTYTQNDLRAMEKFPDSFDNPIISRGMYKDYFNRVIEELKFDYENGGSVDGGDFAKGGGVDNKWKYLFFVQGSYGQGFEDLTAHENREDAKAEMRVYDENENYPHRVILRKVLTSDYEKGKYARGGGVGSRNLDGLETEIHQLKRKLVRQAKLKGISENFGQKEVRMLEDKYPMNFSVGQFDEWVQNFDLNSYSKGGGVDSDGVRINNGYLYFPIEEIDYQLEQGKIKVGDVVNYVFHTGYHTKYDPKDSRVLLGNKYKVVDIKIAPLSVQKVGQAQKREFIIEQISGLKNPMIKDFVIEGKYAESSLIKEDVVKSYEKNNDYARGGGVKGKDNRAKKVIRNVNGFDREYPIGDAWRKEHNQYNKSEKYEIPTSSRK